MLFAIDWFGHYRAFLRSAESKSVQNWLSADELGLKSKTYLLVMTLSQIMYI